MPGAAVGTEDRAGNRSIILAKDPREAGECQHVVRTASLQGAPIAANADMSEQPLAHTSHTGLQELNNLGYSSAGTTGKHL